MGPQGPAGSVPSGTVIFVVLGDPVPEGYDYVGHMALDVWRTDETSGRTKRSVVVNAFKKR
jgi:hypothetical protein